RHHLEPARLEGRGHVAADERRGVVGNRRSAGALDGAERDHREPPDRERLVGGALDLHEARAVGAGREPREREEPYEQPSPRRTHRTRSTQRANASSSRLPAPWLFSGWNCTANKPSL